MKILSKSPMSHEQAAAVAFCVGPRLSRWYCRAHVMTDYYGPKDQHPGLDHVCGRRKNHPNRHKCIRCGLEIARD